MSELSDALNVCLDMLFNGETIEGCIKHYPELADELKPLLEQAAKIRKITKIKARPQFKNQLKEKLSKD